MAGYSILRFQKIKTLGDVKRLAAHHERNGSEVSNASPPYDSRVFLGSADMHAHVSQRLPEKRRSDAVLAMEFVLTTSPESQRKDNTPSGPLDEEKVAKFKHAAREFLTKEFGDAVTARLHLDETTPHVQGFIVPNEGWKSGETLNAKKLFNPKTLAGFQSRWHAACVSAGLEVNRGEPGSQAEHEPIANYYARVNAPTPRPPELAREPQKATTADKLKESIGIETEHKKAVEQRQKTEFERAEFFKNSYEGLTKKASESAASERHALNRAKSAEEKLQSLKQQSQSLRTLPLAKVLEMLGCEKHPKDPLRYRTPAGDVWIEKNDGLRFNSFDDGAIKGRGAIDLVMQINGCDFHRAVSCLAGQHGFDRTQSTVASHFAAKAEAAVQQAIQKHPTASELPTPHPGRLERVKAYLSDVRGIPAALVSSLIDQGKLYADKFANAVFVTDDGQGCELRGTGSTPFHGQRGQKTGLTVIGDPQKVVIVESAIEALSCQATTGMTAVSMAGANLARATEIAKEWLGKGATVFAGQNADLDGGKQAASLIREAPQIHRLEPRYRAKDWNDALQIERAEPETPSLTAVAAPSLSRR